MLMVDDKFDSDENLIKGVFNRVINESENDQPSSILCDLHFALRKELRILALAMHMSSENLGHPPFDYLGFGSSIVM